MNREKVRVARFVPVDDAADVEALIDRSRDERVLLLNYDPYCAINRSAR